MGFKIYHILADRDNAYNASCAKNSMIKTRFIFESTFCTNHHYIEECSACFLADSLCCADYFGCWSSSTLS